MGCTCFGGKCDHQSGGDTLLIELPDDANDAEETITISEETLRELREQYGSPPPQYDSWQELSRQGRLSRSVREQVLSKLALLPPQDAYAAIAAWNNDTSQRTGDAVFLGFHFPPHVQYLYL